ncbi:MAG: hypothetical protein HN348_34095 [Proteobacteria bacterium]|nr:hypothetical protein [Pseudomonadota bacterium]
MAFAQEEPIQPEADEPAAIELVDPLPQVRGKKGLWTGVGLMAAAVPVGALTAAIVGISCNFECMSASFAGAGVGVVLFTGGAVTATVGGTQMGADRPPSSRMSDIR